MKERALVLLISVAVVHVAAAQVKVGLASFKPKDPNVSTPAGYIAIVDMREGYFTPVVTPLDDTCRKAGNGQVKMVSTASFATRTNTVLAITANSGPTLDLPGCVTDDCGMPAGLMISDGRLANPGQTHGPVLYFNHDGKPFITDVDSDAFAAQWAVAGSTNTDNDCPNLEQIGTLLVDRPQPDKPPVPGVCPIPKSLATAARSAVGIDSTGNYLIVLVVEGTDSGGVTTNDLALKLIALGAERAVNFDGGGSAAFYWTPNGRQVPESYDARQMIDDAFTMSPSWSSFAYTYLDPAGTYKYGTTRKIYGSLGFTYVAKGSPAHP